jgi:hypothetical protein
MPLDCDEHEPTLLTVVTGAFLVPGQLDRQRVRVILNGKSVGALEIKQAGMKSYTLDLPAGVWDGDDILVFELPDADSPTNHKLGDDYRLLALSIQRVEVQKASAGP